VSLRDKPVGKIGSVFFTLTGSQHGGQESIKPVRAHRAAASGHGIVGLPNSFKRKMRMDETTGCSRSGASTLAEDGNRGARQRSANEIDGARFRTAPLRNSLR
jgi:hypothetical protein